MHSVLEVIAQVEECPWETSGKHSGQKVLIVNVPLCLGLHFSLNCQ